MNRGPSEAWLYLMSKPAPLHLVQVTLVEAQIMTETKQHSSDFRATVIEALASPSCAQTSI